MAATSPRLPEQFRSHDDHVVDFNVSELVSEAAGPHSPYGDIEFPMPVDTLLFNYPTREERPNLADGH